MNDWCGFGCVLLRVLYGRVILVLLGLGASMALAQVAPGAADVARYIGLHAAHTVGIWL